MLRKSLSATLALPLIAAALSVHATQYTCVSFEYPPLVHRESDGNASGAAIEIVNAVFRSMGDSIKLELYPWGRALSLIENGDRDCIFTLYRSAERENYIDYSNEVLVKQIVYFYTRKNKDIVFDGNLATLSKARIGTAARVNYGPKFEGMRDKLHIDEAPTITLNFMKLVMERVDLVPSNEGTANATMANPELSRYADMLVRLPVPVEIVPSFIGFAKLKKLAGLRDRYDDAFHKFASSPEYRAILSKYHLQDLP